MAGDGFNAGARVAEPQQADVVLWGSYFVHPCNISWLCDFAIDWGAEDTL